MKCHACQNGKLKRGTRVITQTYKGKSVQLNQPGDWCDTCEEGIVTGKDWAVTEKDFLEFKNKVDKILPPKEIKRIRKDILKLTQIEAAHIFGGGKNAFGRYESGQLSPSLSVSNLLKELERHPEDVEYYKPAKEVLV